MHNPQSADSSKEKSGAGVFEQNKDAERIKKQAEVGTERFYELSGASREHRISSEHKVLFSSISEEADHSGFPVVSEEFAKFTALGLEHAGRRRPYNAQYQSLIHRAVLMHYLSMAADVGELADHMRSSFDWVEPISQALTKSTKAEATDYFSSQYGKMKKSLRAMETSEPEYKTRHQAWGITVRTSKDDPAAKKLQEYRIDFERRFRQHLIQSGMMTESEMDEYDHYREQQEFLTQKLVDLCFPDDKSKLREEIRIFENTLKIGANIKLDKEKHLEDGAEAKPIKKLSKERTYPENLPEIAKKRFVNYINKHFSPELRSDAITTADSLEELTTTYHTLNPTYAKFKKMFENTNKAKGDKEQAETIVQETRNFLVSRGKMTREQVRTIELYPEERRVLGGELIDLCFLGNENALRHLIQNYSNAAKLVTAESIKTAKESPYADAIYVSTGLMRGVGHSYADEHGEDHPDDLPEIERKRLEEFLDERCPSERREVAAQLVEELCELEKRYTTDLRPKYLDARERFGNPRSVEIRALESKIRKMFDNRSKIIENLTAKFIQKKITTLKANIASIVTSDYNPENGEVGIFPTGLLIISNEKPTFSLLSPLDERVLKVVREAGIEDSAWINFWTTHQHDCDKVARQALVTSFAADAKLVDDAFDGEVRDYSEKHQVDFPATLDIETGIISDAVQPDDLEMISENLPPTLIDFVDGISLNSPSSAISLKSTRIEAMRFLNGQGVGVGSEMALCSRDRTLHIRSMESLIDAEPEKISKVVGRVLVQVGAINYLCLPSPKKQEFRNLISTRLNISDLQFYKHFGRRPTGAEDKRSVLERMFFIKCFMDYLDGNAGSEVTKFFESIKKKPAITGNAE